MIKLKTNKFKKKHIIKIPKYVKVTYCNNKNILILNGKLGQKVIKSPVKIFLIPDKKLIVVTDIATFVTVRKNFKNLQGTTIGKIKQCLTEISYTLFLKLKLIGVGYRVFPYEKLPNQLYFKLGYSHLIYFQIPNNLTVFCSKSVKIFIYGSRYQNLTQVASQIRSYKIPEVYKGKGILYEEEKIKLKKSKKV